MTAVKRTAGQAAWLPTSPGKGGWCIDGLHDVCSYEPCNCTVCDPAVHHSRAGQAPHIDKIGDPMPWDVDVLTLIISHAAAAETAPAPAPVAVPAAAA